MTPLDHRLRQRLLRLLHRYNGWNVLYLLVTGVILYLPSLRAVTAPFRVPLKLSHIAAGVLMVLMLAAYVPLLPGHWSRLRRRLAQRLNVLLIVGVTLGWAVTGVVLWLHRSFPPDWAAAALAWHDYLTWLVLPWLAVHSATRYFRVRTVRTVRTPLSTRGAPVAERRALLVSLGGAVTAAVWALFGWRSFFVPGGAEAGAAPRMTAANFPMYFDPPHVALATPGRDPAGSEPAAGSESPAALAATPESPTTTQPSAGPHPLPSAAGPPPWTTGQPPVPVPSESPLRGGGRQGRFRVYTVTASLPAFQPGEWQFFARGLVERPLRLTWEQFLHLPRRVQVSDFYCVTGWAVFNITWEGVRLRDVLDLAGVAPEAGYVKFFSRDGVYTDDLSLDVARADDVLLAYLIDGGPLPLQLGGPMRLIVPRMYAYKSVKWLGGIELTAAPHDGYWEQRGYPRDAWVLG